MICTEPYDTPSIRSHGSSGFSLVEVSVALVIITLSLSWMASVVISATGARRDAELKLRASRIGERVVGQIRSTPLATALDVYGGAALSGMPWDGESIEDGVTVTIQIFANETEPVVIAGLPRDLDGDGAIASIDTLSDQDGDGEIDANQLAGVVKVSWRGVGGRNQILALPFVVAKL